MKAAIWTKYGPPKVIITGNMDKPAPKGNEIIIKVKAASVSKADCEMRSLDFSPIISIPMRFFTGLTKPKRIRVLGQELSGIIEDTGEEIQTLKTGDEVMASTGMALGAHAEYVCFSEKNEGCLITGKPANLSFEQASCVPAGGTEAFGFLKRANLKKGQKLLIVGAGGSFGTFAIQLAKLTGAIVTAVDSGPKEDVLKKLGADEFIDYTKGDYTKDQSRYDVIFDIVCKEKFRNIKRLLKPSGTYIAGIPKMTDLIRSAKKRKPGRYYVIAHSGDHSNEDLDRLKVLIEDGKISPVLDKVFTLDETAEAHRFVESGEKIGNVIVSIS